MAQHNLEQRANALHAHSSVPDWRPPIDGISTDEVSSEQIAGLNAQAERCRRLAEATYNREVSEMLGTMAEGYERTAGELSKGRHA